MKFLFFIITSIFIVWSFVVQDNRKLNALMCVLLCFDIHITFIPDAPLFHGARSALVTCLLICMLYQMRKTVSIWQTFPFKWPMLIMLGASLIISIFSELKSDIWHIFSKPVMDFMCTCFILFIFYRFTTECTFQALIPVITVCTVLLTAVGIINLIIGDNPYIEQLAETYNVNPHKVVLNYASTSRFRVNSLQVNAFVYGYTCCVLNLLSMYLKHQRLIGPAAFYTLFLCSLFGIVFCNCRTVFFTYILGTTFYLWITSTLGRIAKRMVFSLLVVATAYTCVPIVQKQADLYLSVFTDAKGKHVGGSSLEGRLTQLGGALNHFYKRPVVGHGSGYLSERLHANKEFKIMAFSDSVVFVLLAESGIIGIMAYLIFYGSIYKYFYKHRKKFTAHSAIGLAVLSMYGFYAVTTGENDSVPITLACLGIVAKNIELSKLRICLNRISQTVDLK